MNEVDVGSRWDVEGINTTLAKGGGGVTSVVPCDNCLTDREIAFTLTTYVEGSDEEAVELDFCSSECLRVWT